MSEQTETAEDSATSDQREEMQTKFELSRVFSLLSLILGMVAMGVASMIYLTLDSRLENIERNYHVTSMGVEERLENFATRLKNQQEAKQAAADSSAKDLLVGSEIARTLYLMRYVAGDQSFSEDARQRAAQMHAQADALLKDIQAGK